jgi:hypothetical protein
MRRTISILLVCAAASTGRADPLPNPDPEVYGEDPPPPPPPPPRSRVPDYIAASVTALLTTATVVSCYQAMATADHLHYERPFESFNATDSDPWKVATFAFGTAAVLSGVATAWLWARHRAPAFDVNATGSSAVVTYAGRF